MKDERNKWFLCVPGAIVQAMLVHDYNLSTADTESRGSRLAQGQLGLHSETLPQTPPTIATNCWKELEIQLSGTVLCVFSMLEARELISSIERHFSVESIQMLMFIRVRWCNYNPATWEDEVGP